jgi:hypothetical protein
MVSQEVASMANTVGSSTPVTKWKEEHTSRRFKSGEQRKSPKQTNQNKERMKRNP